MTFESLGLRPELARALEDSLGVFAPHALQSKALPLALGGEDLIVCAQTGAGKTLMFLLPLLELLSGSPAPQRALVAVPTPELASQIARVATVLAASLPAPLSVSLVLGPEGEEGEEGAAAADAVAASAPGSSIEVGTVEELCRRCAEGSLRLEGLSHVVFDEADALLCEREGRWAAPARPLLAALREAVASGALAPPPQFLLTTATLSREDEAELESLFPAAKRVSHTGVLVPTLRQRFEYYRG